MAPPPVTGGPPIPAVNPNAPTYQAPALDYNTFLSQAKGQLDQSYNDRINGVNAQAPLIQQQYQNYQNDLKQTYQDQTNNANQQLAASQGALRAHNAAMGVNDQGQEVASMQNRQSSTDELLKSLANTLTNKQNSYSNEQEQQLAKLHAMADSIANQRDTTESNTAHQLMGTALQNYNDQYNRQYQEWGAQNSLAEHMAQMQQAQAFHDDQIKSQDARYSAQSNQYQNQNNQWALDQVNKLVAGAGGDNNKSQDAVYNFIKSQGPMLQKMGVDNAPLWQSWQGLKSLADHGVAPNSNNNGGGYQYGQSLGSDTSHAATAINNALGPAHNYIMGPNFKYQGRDPNAGRKK